MTMGVVAILVTSALWVLGIYIYYSVFVEPLKDRLERLSDRYDKTVEGYKVLVREKLDLRSDLHEQNQTIDGLRERVKHLEERIHDKDGIIIDLSCELELHQVATECLRLVRDETELFVSDVSPKKAVQYYDSDLTTKDVLSAHVWHSKASLKRFLTSTLPAGSTWSDVIWVAWKIHTPQGCYNVNEFLGDV